MTTPEDRFATTARMADEILDGKGVVLCATCKRTIPRVSAARVARRWQCAKPKLRRTCTPPKK